MAIESVPIMIDREEVAEMFTTMESEGVDIHSEMVWGYYFVDPNIDKLEAVVPDLEANGFDFVELLEAESDEDEEKYFILRVERLEVHSVDSLDQLNRDLDAFAEAHGLEAYDGMDVAPIEED